MYDSNYNMDNYRSNNNNREFMEMFAKMFGDNMYNKMDNYRSNSDSSMSRFFDMFKRNRVQRAASEDGALSPSLDLGDRLVEKLNEQRHEMQAKIGNMTCVLKHMGCLNNNNELDLNGMREEMKQYTMPSPWFSQIRPDPRDLLRDGQQHSSRYRGTISCQWREFRFCK